MISDPILKEMREIADQQSKECNNDIHTYFQKLKEHQKESVKKGFKVYTKADMEKEELQKVS